MTSATPARSGYVVKEYSKWLRVDFNGDDCCHYEAPPVAKSLWIERNTAEVTESEEPLTDELPRQEVYANAILGLVNINGSIYLNAVVHSEPVVNVSFDQATAADCRTSPIFSVKHIQLFPVKLVSIATSDADLLADEAAPAGGYESTRQKSPKDSPRIGVYRRSHSPTNGFDHNAHVISDLDHLLSTGHYFSRATDLTHSLQRQWEQNLVPLRPRRFAAAGGAADSRTLFEMADPTFNWSGGLAYDIPTHWLTPLMQGYVGYSQQNWNGKRVELLLIGRRSVHRAGTRLNARGIDGEGHVGNFVESEMRVRVDGGSWKSFVQARGSVPVFWGQRNIFSQPYFTRPIDESERAFLLHYHHLARLYGAGSEVCMLSLLDSKASEGFLTQALEHLVHTFSYLPLRLVKYNYNEKVKWSSVVTELLNFVNLQLLGALNGMGYFDGDMLATPVDAAMRARLEQSHVPGTQRGVFRINCLDCLDRTNAMQLMVAWVWLARVLDPDGMTNMLEHNEDCEHDFGGAPRQFREMWCAHGDNISWIHAGTASIYSQHIREGRHSYGALFHYTKTMVTRACNYAFTDESRQLCLNVMLNSHASDAARLGAADAAGALTAAPDFEAPTSSDVVVWCGTWNMNGAALSSRDDIGDWISRGVEKGAEVFVFFLQEFVELSVMNVLSGKTEENKEMLFNGKVLRALGEAYQDRGLRFVHLKSCSMVGLYMAVFVSERLRHSVRDLETSSVKTGFSGNVGNKGAVGVRFAMAGHRFTFVDVHLNSGKLPTRVRAQELEGIMKNIFSGQSLEQLFAQDLLVFAGDFNFQIQRDDDHHSTTEIFKYIYNGQPQQLLQYDEFLSEVRHVKPYMCRLQEAPIAFDPTYKFKKRTDYYDVKRTPAWCDRILFGGAAAAASQARLSCACYSRHDLMLSSDHKAVSAVFKLEAAKGQSEAELATLIDL
ncbi:endonuclease/exonuclease/phosphatase family protein [Babesia caballi]|uniref:phosphoinositide 5-phosphatase n=1 Tax=Babesia caballi TaxID=5871 RepID=A0AAV4LQR8_BABCB|nr:endonuclease/exonuclease/phosphatase family protein [Babesia caballi]